MKTTIIYNQMSMTAVLATAILKSHLDDVEVASISQLVNDESDRYIWVGINPKRSIEGFMIRTRKKEHVIIVEAERAMSAIELMNPFMKIDAIEHGDDHHDAMSIKSTLIDITCKLFDIQNEDYHKLDFHAARFYERSTKVQFLAFVYSNLLEANRCITLGDKFAVKAMTANDVDVYMQHVKQIKVNFTSIYQKKLLLDGTSVRSAIHTSVSDFSFHLVLRLTRLAHRNFLNMSMGMSGAIAYTNMRHVQFDQSQGKPLVLN